jgi:transposase
MNEFEPLTIERIDDVPLLLAQLERIQVAHLLDRHFPTHGNWQGLSLGMVSAVWLSHILSEGDHWLNHVEPWAARQHCLQACLGQEVRSLDFTDDRLAAVLDYLSDDERWQVCERELGQHLFQFGHSKDHRPDSPQVKIKLSALDPLGVPLGVTIIGGQRADDGLYVPVAVLSQQAQTVSHVTPLSALQECIMALLGFPSAVYSTLALHSYKLTFQMSEP